ncbi:MAG: extracellular solute-binding protein [Defluviitaleaceae bacterium]|nr:extracellular solute-binding protein [Defluviitaleaceae bacterium]
MKKIFYVLILSALVFVACGSCGESDPPGHIDLSHELLHGRDLGGMVITITRMAPGMPDECSETYHLSEWIEWLDDEMLEQLHAQWAARRALEERYNFRVRYVGYGEMDTQRWDQDAWARIETDFIEGLEAEIRAGNRDYTVWALSPMQIIQPNSLGLLAPIPPEAFPSASERAWNRMVWDWSMRGGVPHAFSPEGEGLRWPSGRGILFNMRLFEEAGLPPDLPFTLQASGEWTWDALHSAARQIATMRGPESEIVPLAFMNSQDFTGQALMSNDADFTRLNFETGQFVDATNSPEFLQTLEWLVEMRDEGLVMDLSRDFRVEDRGEWTTRTRFDDENAAMFASSFHSPSELPHNEWGFVTFPKGPNATSHYTPSFRSPIYVIPYFFSPQEVEDIIFALGQWYRATETDDMPSWMGMANETFENADPRSISETMVNFTENPELHRMLSINMMPWLSWEDSFSYIWQQWDWYSSGDWFDPQPSTQSVQEIIAETQSAWYEFLERINN